jgi:hypothetical protein
MGSSLVPTPPGNGHRSKLRRAPLRRCSTVIYGILLQTPKWCAEGLRRCIWFPWFWWTAQWSRLETVVSPVVQIPVMICKRKWLNSPSLDLPWTIGSSQMKKKSRRFSLTIPWPRGWSPAMAAEELRWGLLVIWNRIEREWERMRGGRWGRVSRRSSRQFYRARQGRARPYPTGDGADASASRTSSWARILVQHLPVGTGGLGWRHGDQQISARDSRRRCRPRGCRRCVDPLQVERKKMIFSTTWVPPVGDWAKRYAPWAPGGLTDGLRWWASIW